MFQHANGSKYSMRQMFLSMERNELEVVLGQRDETIYFTKTHIADLRAVIEAEQTRHRPGEERRHQPSARPRTSAIAPSRVSYSRRCLAALAKTSSICLVFTGLTR